MNYRAIVMGVAFAIIWSSAFTSARIIVQSAPPISISAVRFLIAGLIATGLAFAFGQRAAFTKRQWRAIIIFGLCQNAIYLGLMFIAMQRIEASLAAIIAATMPLWAGLISAILFAERLPKIAVVGLALGFVGVASILLGRDAFVLDPMGVGLAFLGVLALTIATLSVKNASDGKNLLMVVGVQMLVGGIALVPFALLFETWEVDWRPEVIIAFVYTVIMPGLVATYIWFRLVNMIGATRAASFHFLNPFFGVVIAAVVLAEGLTVLDVIGVTIASLGIYLVQRSRAKP